MSVVLGYSKNMRASRLLAILILLQLRGRLTARALSEEFEVSERTIYRDIDALSASGVPVYGDKGHGGGFTLDAGYRTRLTGLDAPEIEALMLAGLPGAASALGIGPEAAKARNKLLAALPGEAARSAERLSSAFHVDLGDWYQAESQPTHLPSLVRAILDRQSVRFTYESWKGRRDWRVDPLGIVLKAGRWYVLGRGSKGITAFNITEISAFRVLDVVFVLPDNFVLADHWARHIAAFEQRLRPAMARLRVGPQAAQRLAQQGSYALDAIANAQPDRQSGWMIVQLPFENAAQLVRLVLDLGPEAELIEPQPARRAMIEQINALQQTYGKDAE